MLSQVSSVMSSVAVEQLADIFRERLSRPGAADYDEARAVWNGMIDRYPALIVRPANEVDVVTAVNHAREHSLLLSVRGGGHNVAGHAVNDGGLVIDLSLMNQVVVEPEAGLVRAGGGATIGDLDKATQAYGLAVPMGVVTATGIAGLTLGGGYGWLRNKYGLSCDNLVAAELVTAAGQIVRASKDENADLLWGLRGGGGNFGVVTEFVYQAHPVGPEVMFVFVFHDGRDQKMQRAIELYRDFSASAADEISTLMALGQIPPEPEHFPAELHNVPFVLFGGLYAGPVEEGQQALRPLLEFSQPLIDASGVMPYVEAQQMFDADYPDGRRYYWKSLNVNRLDEAVIECLIDHARRQPSPYSTLDIWHVGGAVSRVSPEASAFYGRQAAFMVGGEANWIDAADDAANLAWLRSCMADLAKFSDGSSYLNFAGFQEEGDEMMRQAFGPQYERLVALKNKYDPKNLFHLNQNVKPTQHLVGSNKFSSKI
jgi:FAD/FMN-containing dehydrogenase